MKTKHPVHIMVFSVVISSSDDMPQFIFSHGLRLNMEASIKCLEDSTVLDQEGDCWKTLNLPHATQKGEPNIGCEKISVTTYLTSGCLTAQITIPFNYYMLLWLNKW